MYKPRHYDPVMEDLHSRVKIIEAEIRDDESSDASETARARIRKAWHTPEARKSADMASSIRIAIIFIILSGFFYAYFFTNLFS